MSARIPTLVGAVVFLLVSFHRPVQADIRINEFSPETNPEWVELYNPDKEPSGLSGVVLYFADSTDTTQKVSFCSGTALSGNAYGRVVRPNGSYWLSNTGDTLMLKREDDTIDSITFGNPLLKAPVGTQSATRNETGEWTITDNPSPAGEVISLVCPTLIATNTPVPTATTVPDVTGGIVASSTKTGTPTVTERPTSFVRILSTVAVEDEMVSQGAVLGFMDQTPEATATSQDALSEKRPYVVALLFVGIGLALLAAVSVVRIRYTKDI
jgi:hypothetical protein